MLKQKFIIDFGSKLFIYFLTALTGILVARLAGPEVVGTIAFGTSFASMFFFMFGVFGPSHIKLLNKGENKENCQKIYSIIIFITFIVFVLIVLGFFYTQKYYFGKNYSVTEEIVIFLSIGIIALKGLFKIPEITFTAYMQQVKINYPKILKAFVFNIGRIIVILIGLKAVALVSVNLFSSIILIPIYLYLMGKGFFKGKWENELFKKYLKIGVPILIITAAISFTGGYSIVLFKDLSSTIQLGYFYGATSLASMLVMVGGTAGSLFFPLFSKAYLEKNYAFIKTQMNKYEHFIFLFVLPLIIVLSVNSNTIILFLLGEEYIESVPIFSILVFFSFAKIWGIPYNNLINGMNRFNLNARLHIFYALLFFGIFYIMVDKNYLNMGGLGLSLSLLITAVIRLTLWYFFSNKEINIKFDKFIFQFSIFFIVIYFIGKLIFENYIIDLNYLLKFTYLIIYTLFIYLSLFLLKLMKKDDIVFIMKLVNLKDLLDYSKKELKNK